MSVTERELNRATLARQLLLERHTVTVPAAVQRIVAIQAQEPASPYLSLWNPDPRARSRTSSKIAWATGSRVPGGHFAPTPRCSTARPVDPGSSARQAGSRLHPTGNRYRTTRRPARWCAGARNGDVLPTVLVDGYVAGVWRRVDAGIEVTARHPVDAAAWDQLEGESRALATFLADREPTVYCRYARWWESLTSHETRVLPT